MFASGIITFSTTDQTNIGQTLHDGDAGSANISGIQVDIYNANSSSPNVPVGSFAYFASSYLNLGSNGGIGPLDVTTGTFVSSNPPDLMVIKGDGGAAFSFKSIEVLDWSGSQGLINFEAFRSGISLGSVTLSVDQTTFLSIFTQQNGLTASIFENVDEIRISNVTGVVSGNWAAFNNIEIGDPVVPGPAAPTTTVSTASFSADTGTSSTDFITKTATQTISGTLSANLASGESVEVSYDGGSTWSNASTYAVGSNSWSTTTTLSGSSTFEARVTNSGGSSTAYTHTYTLDTTAPTITFSGLTLSADTGASSSDFITQTAAQTITATLSSVPAGTDIVYGSLDNGATWTNITNKVSGTTLSWNGVTLTGSDTLKLKVTDVAGNDGAVSGQAYVLDTTSPTVTVASAAFSADTGTSSTDFITKTASQTISGTLSANLSSGETVYVSLDNGITWTVATATVGQNTWSLSGQTLTASNTLKVRVTDTAGNNGTALSQAYVLDTTAPATTVSTASFSADTGNSSTDFITNTAAQTISGTLSANLAAGEVVYVSLDNGSTWTAATTSVGSNTWSLAGQTLTASNTLKIKVSDAAGNDGTVRSQAYTLDTSAPSAPSTPDMNSASDTGASSTDNITSNTTPVFTGTAESGSTVTLYDTDGTTVLGTAVATGGTWSITSSALSSGTHTITAKATDTAGNTSTASSSLSITVDTAAPTAIALSSSSVSNTAGSNTAVGTLSSTDATVGDSFTYTLVSGTGSTDNASFSISGSSLVATNPSALTAGSYSVRVRSTDVAGNTYEQAFSITVTSNQAPSVTTPTAITLVDTSATDTFSNQTGTLAATDTDGVASYGIQGGTTGGTDSIGGVSYDVSKAGTYGTLYVKSSDGSYVYVPNATAINARKTSTSETFTVTATDANVSPATGTATLTVNITGANDDPTDLALSAATVNQSAGANATVGTLTSTDADTGETFTYTLVSGAGDTNNGSFNISGGNLRATNPANLAAGTYSVRVRTTDGSSSTYEEALSITVVDDVAPTVSSVSVPSNGWYSAGQNLDFTVNLSEAVIVNTTGGTPRIALTVGSTTVYATYVSGSGTSALTFRYTVQANELDTDGIAVGALGLNGGTIQDAAGNNATLTLNSVGSTTAVKVDAVNPSAPSVPDLNTGSDTGASSTDNITNDNTPTLSGTAEANSTVAIYDGATLLGTATADGTGSWSYTTSTLSNGSHTLTAKATDAAGNDSPLSTGLTITVDAAAPTAVSLSQTSVAETAATSGSTVASLSATDSNTVTYALVSGSGDTNNTSFNIVSGNLQAASNLSAGTYNIRVRATDLAGNTTDQTFTITVTAGPSVSSINRAGATALTNATSVDYTVTFSESVTQVDLTDFMLSSTGSATGTISAVSGTGSTYTVTVSGLSGDGTLRLDLKNTGTGIVNGGSQAIIGGFTSGQTYTLDTTAPSAPSGLDLLASSDSGSSSTDNNTSDNTPTISGAGAEPNCTVTLYDTDGTTVLGTTTADGTGAWTITSSTLTDGVHTITTKVTDAAGNTSAGSAALTVTIDTTAPSASGTPDLASASDSGSSNTDNTTSVTTPVITGSGAEVGATVTLYDTNGTTVLGTATADSSGNWSITSSTLSSGAHTLTTKVTDASGNTGVASAGLTVTIDTTAPSASGAPDLASASDSGSSNSDNITSVTTPTITGGGAEAGATVTLYDTDGTTVLGTATADGSGNWSITSSTLSSGAHTLTTKVTDATGNTGAASAGLTLTIDSIAPSASGAPDLANASDSGASGTDNITGVTTPTITGGGAEAGATVTLYDTDGTTVLGTATADGSGNWSITSSTLSSGTHTLTTKVTDAAGNTGAASAGLTVTVDTVAPTAIALSANSVMDVVTGVNTTVATLSATDAQAVTYALVAGNGTNDSGNSSFVIVGGNLQSASALTAGTYNIRIRATDAAGNVSNQDFVITVNTNTAPTITSGASASVAENAAISTVVYTATASDVDVGQTLSYSLTGTDASLFDIHASTGVVTLKASANYEVKSSYSFNVVVTDSGTGNLTDTKAVTVTVIDANDPSTGVLVVTGEARQGQTLSVTDTLADEDGISGRTYQWLADGVPIQGAHQSSLTLELAQAGKVISVQVSYTDSHGRVETLQSAATPAVIGLAPVVIRSTVAVTAGVGSAPSMVEPLPVMSIIPVTVTNVPVVVPIALPVERDARSDSAIEARTLQGFSVPVITRGAAPLPEVLVLRDMSDQSATRVGSQLIVNFDVPASTFAHTDSSAVVSLSAVMADGKPLPGWLKFNPVTGEFRGIAPANYQGSLEVSVVATDNHGSKAVTRFRIDLEAKPAKTSDAGKPRLQAELRGQSSFAWKAERDAWIRHARDAGKVNRTAAST